MLDEAQARAAQAETRQGEGDINTDDDDDDTAEYELWHRREMARIARSACTEHTLCQAVYANLHIWVMFVVQDSSSCVMGACLPVFAAMHMALWQWNLFSLLYLDLMATA